MAAVAMNSTPNPPAYSSLGVLVRMASISFWVPAIFWQSSHSCKLSSSAPQGIACPLTLNALIFVNIFCLAHGALLYHPEL